MKQSRINVGGIGRGGVRGANPDTSNLSHNDTASDFVTNTIVEGVNRSPGKGQNRKGGFY